MATAGPEPEGFAAPRAPLRPVPAAPLMRESPEFTAPLLLDPTPPVRLHALLAQTPAADSGEFLRTTLACLQLQRGFKGALWRAQQLTDARVHGSAASTRDPTLSEITLQVLREIATLVEASLISLRVSLHNGIAPDRDQMAAREILINALEHELREQLSAGNASAADLLAVALVDALECVGNQLYRLGDACCAPEPHDSLPRLAAAV